MGLSLVDATRPTSRLVCVWLVFLAGTLPRGPRQVRAVDGLRMTMARLNGSAVTSAEHDRTFQCVHRPYCWPVADGNGSARRAPWWCVRHGEIGMIIESTTLQLSRWRTPPEKQPYQRRF